MEYVSSSKVAGDTPVGKGVYTTVLDSAGGVQADLTVLRLAEDRFRVIDGGDAGNRDATYLRRMTQDKEWSVFVEDRTDHYGCIGVWGPNARASLKKLADALLVEETIEEADVVTLLDGAKLPKEAKLY